MNDKFRYAPGIVGYGTKGSDGSAGLQGFSMYFTNYDAVSQVSEITLAIQNNYVLWSDPPTIFPNISLPNNRVYITGDLFVDSEGKIYEINAETDTFIYKFASLSTTGYFTNTEVSSGTYNFNRYFNSNTTPKYLIDNVYADGAIAYYNIPSKVYGIEPINFARIEYSNIEDNGYNPFTLYSSAETKIDDDAKALAIVRETASNTFRIGNLKDDGSIRNVNLIFDVSSLKRTKQNISKFNIGTPDGEILTNYEIDANALFTGVFRTAPTSFYSGFNSTDISIFWKLSDFTADPNVNADLYFFQNASTSGIISLANDASTYRPMVFHDVSTSGSVYFTSLPATTSYKYYMNFHKNGWERRSVIKNVATGIVPNITLIPSTTIEASSNHWVEFCVSSNVAWTATYAYNPDEFMYDISSGYTLGSDVSLWIDVSENRNATSRDGIIIVSALSGGGNSPRYATITQKGTSIIVDASITEGAEIDNTTFWKADVTQTAILNINGLPASTIVNVKINYLMSLIPLYIDEHMGIQGSSWIRIKSADFYIMSFMDLGNQYATLSVPRINPGTITISDVSISNFPINLTMHLIAEPDEFVTSCRWDATLDITDVSIIYVSGLPIDVSYGNTQAHLLKEQTYP